MQQAVLTISALSWFSICNTGFMGADYYTILGIPYNATSEEVRNAYFQLARQLHPDKNSAPDKHEQFLQLQIAYEVLSNAERRAAYDANLPPEMRTGPEISINAKYSRSWLARIEERQLVYVLLDLICTADIRSDQIPPYHICLVLDQSTSMKGSRMDMVKSSAQNLVQQLRPQDLLSVVAFGDRAQLVIPPTRASSLSRSDARISLLQTGGGTEIYQGLAMGVEQLRRSAPAYTRHLVLLTDGHTYGDEEACLRLASEASQEGISISALGIGNEWNDGFMDRLSGASGGHSIYISSPKELDRCVIEKAGQLGSMYARGIRFEFESSPGVTLKYAFRLNPDIGPVLLSKPLQLGDIQHRKSISVLLEFMLNPMSVDVDHLVLARGPIWMDLSGQSSSNQVRLLVDLSLPVKANIEHEAPPAVIVEAMSRLTLYRMQEKVREEVGAGEIEKATRHLQYLATHLLSQGDRELAHTVLVEAEHVRQTRSFSKEGDKRIKYGTRALLLPAGSELKL